MSQEQNQRELTRDEQRLLERIKQREAAEALLEKRKQKNQRVKDVKNNRVMLSPYQQHMKTETTLIRRLQPSLSQDKARKIASDRWRSSQLNPNRAANKMGIIVGSVHQVLFSLRMFVFPKVQHHLSCCTLVVVLLAILYFPDCLCFYLLVLAPLPALMVCTCIQILALEIFFLIFFIFYFLLTQCHSALCLQRRRNGCYDSRESWRPAAQTHEDECKCVPRAEAGCEADGGYYLETAAQVGKSLFRYKHLRGLCHRDNVF